MFPILLIAIGIAVLVLGKRLAVLGAAVGALLGIGLLYLFPGSGTPLLSLGLVILLAVIGFFVSAFAKGLINIILLVIGALAGAAIVLGFLNLFNISPGLLNWVLAVAGGVVGLVLIRRARRGSQDWGIIILAGLVGALLVTRGLTIWLPFLQGFLGTLVVIVLAIVSIIYQGGILTGRKAVAPVQTTPGTGTSTGDQTPPPSTK
jgi:hypothetical protein